MALTPLQEIISRARQISPLNTQPEDPNQPDLDLHAKRNSGAVVLVNKPKSFDSGNSQVRVPVYSRDEMKDFPNITEGAAIDLLAWYSSFHYGELGWGIYILRSGIYRVANALIDGGYPEDDALETAQQVLLRHEQTHFQTDLAVTSLEFALDAPLFIEARRNMKLLSPGWHVTEEGLANALARRMIKRKPKDAFDEFLYSSPAGYCDWKRYTPAKDPQSWDLVIRELLDSGPRRITHTNLAAEVSNKLAPSYFSDIPVYEVYDIPNGDLNGAYIMGPISDIVETHAFKLDLAKLVKGQPVYKKKWIGVKKKLAAGNLVGVHLELINKVDSIYSVRIDGEARAGLTCDFSLWSAIAAGHHDELYRRLSKI